MQEAYLILLSYGQLHTVREHQIILQSTFHSHEEAAPDSTHLRAEA